MSHIVTKVSASNQRIKKHIPSKKQELSTSNLFNIMRAAVETSMLDAKINELQAKLGIQSPSTTSYILNSRYGVSGFYPHEESNK